MKPKTSFLQKILLISFGILCCLLLIETGLRLGGWVFSSLQQHRNYLSVKQKTDYRILCLGESTTAKQYPSFLEEILNRRNIGIKFSVIDGGIPGTNTSHILDRLESNLDQYLPDMVITMMGINDFGSHMPHEAVSDSKAVNFFKSFGIYKLIKLLGLHIVTRLKELKSEELSRYATQLKFILQKGELQQIHAKDKARELNLKNDKVYAELGWFYRKQGRFPEAEASFKKAIEVNPKNDKACVDLGQLYLKLGRLPDAEASFKKAIEVNPKNDEAHFVLGWFYRRQGKFPEAEAIFKKAIEANPEDNKAYINLGQFYRKQGRFPEAEASFKKAIEANPEDNAAYVDLGWVYRRQGRFPEAEASFKKAIEVNPKDNNAYIVLGKFYRRQGRFPEAEASFKKAIEANPEDNKAYVDLGKFYLRQGRFPEAEASFKKAIEVNPKDNKAYGALTVLYIEMGNSKLAREYDKKTTELGFNYYPAMTIGNYHGLKAILDRRGIVHVCVQYPMRSLENLKKIFQGNSKNIIFVDNEIKFRDALRQGSYNDYFNDTFGGNFGHCTDKGNRLLAENIANVILKEVFGK